MWPKVFAQLVEILPHISRLIPMADVFFASRSAGDKASQAAIAAMSEDVRTDLGKINSAHESLYRQLQDQGQQIATAAADISRTRATIESHANRIVDLEKEVSSLSRWTRAVVGLLILVLCLLIALLVRR